MTRVIAFDPGVEVVGYALYEDMTLLDYGLVPRAKDFHQFDAVLDEMAANNIAVCVIEDQYAPGIPKGHLGPRLASAIMARGGAVLKVAAVKGEIEAPFRRKQCMVVHVYPREWQSIFKDFDINFLSGNSKRKNTKENSLIVAEHIAGKKIDSDHVADAICMGWWCITNMEVEGD